MSPVAARPSVAFVTTTPSPIEYDADRPFLDRAAGRCGIDAPWVSWRDPDVDWSRFDAVLIHSTWDYHEARDEFVRWAERVGAVSRLHNPAPIVEWNSHKGYLPDLDDWGIPTVPTVVVRSGAPEAVGSIAQRGSWDRLVLKPAVGAGALGASRWSADDPGADRALTELLGAGDALAQPYLDEIEDGETSVVVLAGEVTHAVGKVPAVGDFRVQLHHGGRERSVEPTDAEVELAMRAVEVVGREVAPISYARVDCVTVDGRPRLMELEVLEPSLFLQFAPEGTADRLLTATFDRTGH